MGQKNSPKELKNTSGARTLVAVSKVKLNKEQKKEMCMGALQKEKTMMHLLGDTYSQLYNDKVVRSTRYCDQDVDPPVIQIPSRKPEDYIDDIVLEDPVLNEMNKIAHKMKADSSTITSVIF
uniref:Uncharacterized protein n=1 Tax=Spongospora subterranea TaxID=70186 RepID=A0A0H5RFK0_9EUKA|eukprot:CRZ12506.1 hypothetical protein [Spongospora subterranea]